jgi:hypothetical protein
MIVGIRVKGNLARLSLSALIRTSVQFGIIPP